MEHHQPITELPLFLELRSEEVRLGSQDWDAVLQGDRQALDALFTKWMPVTLQWCRRLGGPRVDAEQAAQEIFIIVLRRVHTVYSEEVFQAWLYGVTKRVLAQQRRKVWGLRWDSSAQVERLPRRWDGGAPLDERAQLIEQVWGAISQLKEPLREVLVLCDIEGRTDPEVAQLLKLPVGTVKSRLRRARADFRALIEKLGLMPGGEP